VGEPDALCVSIALALKVQGQNFIQSVEEDEIVTRSGPPGVSSFACLRGNLQGAALTMPPSFAESLDTATMRSVPLLHIQGALSMNDSDLVQSTWLSFITSCGCAHAPFPLLGAPLLLQSQIIFVQDPFVFAQGRDAMLIAANACVFPTSLSLQLCRALQKFLWAGRTVLVQEVTAAVAAGDAGLSRETHSMLQSLLQARAISVVQ